MPYPTIARRCPAAGLAWLLLAAAGGANAPRAPTPATPGSAAPAVLEQGSSVEREIYDQPHSYEIHLRANDFLQLEVESKGREVSMALFRPDGAVLFQRNPWGTERFVEIASAHGVYRLELRALQAGARYRLAVTELHPATERDSKRLAAQNAFKNGEQLSAKSTKDSLKKAIASFDEALALWQAAGEETGIGSTGLEAVAISPDGSMFGYGRTDATMVLAANPFTALLQPDDR